MTNVRDDVTDWEDWLAAKRYAEAMARLDREQAEVEATCAKLLDPDRVLMPVVCLNCNRTLGYVRLTAGARADFYCQACDRFEMLEGKPQ